MGLLTGALLAGGASAGGSLLGGFFSKPKKPKTTIFPTMTPQQQQAYGGYLDYLGGRVGKGISPFGYGPWTPWAKQAYKRFRKPAMREFSKRILPAIREQYAATGSLFGGRRHRAEADAGVRLAEFLGAKRFDFERQAFSDYLRTVPEMNPALQMLLSALQIPMFGTTVSQQPSATAPLGAAAQQFGGGIGQALMFKALSDQGGGGSPLYGKSTYWDWG